MGQGGVYTFIARGEGHVRETPCRAGGGGCRSRTIDVGGKWRGSFLFENGRSDEVGCKVVSEEGSRGWGTVPT